MLRPVTTPCPRCGQFVTLYLTDGPAMLNGPYMSALIWQHPEHTLCPGCGVALVPAVLGIAKLTICATPVPQREERQRVIVPSPSNGA